jgi:hypothetical protein
VKAVVKAVAVEGVEEVAVVVIVEANAVDVAVETVPTDTARPVKRTTSFFFPFTMIPTDHITTSDSDKKVHQSWGGDDGNTELKVEEAATVDAATEGAADNAWGAEAAAADDAWGAPVAAADDAWALPAASGDEPAISPAAEGDKNEGRRAREKEQEEEDNTLTLDQYLAQKVEKEASLLPKLETRKANEGADDTLWKDAIPVQKTDEEAYFATKVWAFFFTPCS